MRASGRVAALAGAVVGLVAAMSGAAQAGGPTSAIVVSPSANHATAIYYSDSAYDALMSGIGSEVTGPASPPKGAGMGDAITVTWLIHDVSVWRVDRIFHQSTGTIWIATGYVDGSAAPADEAQADVPPGPWPAATPVWHKAADSAALRAVIGSLGVLNSASKPTSAPTPAAESPSAVVPVAAAGSGEVDGLWWGAGGLVLGAAAVVGLTRRTKREPAGPPTGQEIYIDLDPPRA